MGELSALKVILAVVMGILVGCSYLMLFRPLTFFEWLVRRRLSWWGVTATLTNEAQFRRMARIIGALLLVIAVLIGIIGRACGGW